MDDSESTTLKEQFLQGMSCAAATVNVVTTDGKSGRAGLTVSAMTSISADTEKPTLLICVNEKSAGADPVRNNGVFALNVLSDTQSNISDTFAGWGGLKGEDKFQCGEWSSAITGAPLLNGAVVSFDCSIINITKIGTHYLIIGQVEHVRLSHAGNALVYVSRSYSKTTPLVKISQSQPRNENDEQPIKIACLSSFGPMYLPQILEQAVQVAPKTNIEIFEGNQSEVTQALVSGDVDIAILYDHDLPSGIVKHHSQEMMPHILLPTDHPLASKESIHPIDIVEDDFILLDTSLSTSYFLSVFQQLNIEPKITMRSRSMEMVRSLVGRGLGYSMLVSKPYDRSTYDGNHVSTVAIDGAIRGIRIACATRPEISKMPVILSILEHTKKILK